MKYSLCAIFIALMIFTEQSTQAQSKKFGLGVVIGEPTGVSAKLWTSSTNALAFGVGWSFEGYTFDRFDSDYDKATRLHIHVDYLWHAFNAIDPNRQFPLYYGIGGRINTGTVYSGTLGIGWLPHSVPLDVFIEVVPSLQLVNSTGFGIDAGIGARFFF